MSQFYSGQEHTFFNENDTSVIIKALEGQTLDIPTFQINGHLRYISKAEDFPTAINGVITLVDNKTYVIMGNVDLGGLRIVAAANTSINGSGSESSNLTSTGLGVGVPFITSVYTINFQNITIHDLDTLFDLQAGVGQVLDWRAFNIENIPTIGLIKDYSNVILTDCAWLNSSQCTFNGTSGTIGIGDSLMTNFRNTTTIILAPTLVITRRFKIIESSMVTSGTGSSIDFNVSVTSPPQSFVLTSINFSGGTSSGHILGIQSTDNKALFFKCLGIANSRTNGTFHTDVAAATSTSGTWTKILGTTTPGVINQKVTHLDNRLTYTGTINQIFSVGYNVSSSGSNGNVIEIGVGKGGTNPEIDTVSVQTLDSGGKISHQGITTFIELVENDYLELFIRNLTTSNNVTCTSVNLAIIAEF